MCLREVCPVGRRQGFGSATVNCFSVLVFLRVVFSTEWWRAITPSRCSGASLIHAPDFPSFNATSHHRKHWWNWNTNGANCKTTHIGEFGEFCGAAVVWAGLKPAPTVPSTRFSWAAMLHHMVSQLAHWFETLVAPSGQRQSGSGQSEQCRLMFRGGFLLWWLAALRIFGFVWSRSGGSEGRRNALIE